MKEKYLNRICPVCGGKTGKILTVVDMILDAEMKIPNQYDVVCCKKCGFTYGDVNADQDTYNEYYANDNCYSCDNDIKVSGAKISIEHMKKFLLKYVKKNELILDIGCGSGDLLKSLKKDGYVNLTGMDPSQESLDKLSESGINGIKRNIFEPINDNNGKYDTIISTCVMEHILDLNTFIDIVVQYLKPNGKFFVVVPAVEGFEKYYQAKPNYFNHEHINYFSKVALKNLLLTHNMVSMDSGNGEYYCVGDDHGNQDLMIQNIFKINTETKEKILYDSESENSIIQYIEMDNNLGNKIDDLLRKIENQKCIVWGAGSLTRSLMVNEKFAKYVDGFVDNNVTKIGKNILGKEIFAPKILKEDKFRNHLIVVACMRYSESILKQIDDMGISNKVIVY